jgi:CheY-like chemotaxis protein
MMKQPTCFLIDDDEDDREIFVMALENADETLKCVTAKNGIEALKLIEQDIEFIPDFVFLDLNMPYMTGKECLKMIKQNERLNSTPVIIYTTSSYTKDIEDTKEMGAAHFLVKPAGMGSLTNILSDLLTKSELPYFITTKD